MTLHGLRFGSVLLTAIAMAAGLAHVFELPNKIGLDREAYLAVQQLYRGWALLGIPLLLALVSVLTLAVRSRRLPGRFYPAMAAAVCLAVSLAVFLLFTYPANQQTANWTVLPENWEALRRQWEFSHAVAAGFDFVAFALLVFSVLDRGER